MGISSVQLLSRVQLFPTPWTAAHQASWSNTNSWSLLKLTSIQSVMPSNHLILCRPLNLSQHQGLFQWVSSLHQEAKVFSFSISPSNEYSGLISFRTDWFDLFAVQMGMPTGKSFVHHFLPSYIQKILQSSKQNTNWATKCLYSILELENSVLGTSRQASG